MNSFKIVVLLGAIAMASAGLIGLGGGEGLEGGYGGEGLGGGYGGEGLEGGYGGEGLEGGYGGEGFGGGYGGEGLEGGYGGEGLGEGLSGGDFKYGGHHYEVQSHIHADKHSHHIHSGHSIRYQDREFKGPVGHQTKFVAIGGHEDYGHYGGGLESGLEGGY